MTFPNVPLDVTTELYYSGAWHDITSDVRHDEGITIQRGRSDEQSSASPSTCSFKLANNSPHPYSPELPTSALYGLIGRNTRVRTRIGASDVALTLAGGSDPFPGGWVETPDAAALDITGDIDIRLDLEPAQWRWFPVNVTSTHFVTLAGKHESDGDQRSWVCAVRHDGHLRFRIFTLGTTGSAISYLSTEPVPIDSGRLAIRVTLDVDNGAAGHDVKFWTASDIDGTWTQLGDTVTTAGTTSIYSSTAPVTVGSVADGEGYAAGTTTYTGLVRAFQLYDGIGGTLVADPDFTAQDTFTTSFADSTSKTWTLHRTAEFVNDSARHCGEVPDWSSQWDSTGNDVWVPISASGILRRLRQGDRPINSPMRNAYTLHSFEDLPLAAYWPCEDEESATQIASGIGGPPMTVGLIEGFPTRDIGFSGYTGFVASQPITTFGVTTAHGEVPATDATGRIHVSFLMHVPDSGLASTLPIITLDTTGSAAQWSLECNTSGALIMVADAIDGTNLLTSGPIAFDVNGKDLYVQLDFVQNGSDVDWTIITGEQGSTSLSSGFGSFGATLTGETIGAPTKVYLSKTGDLGGTALGHVAVRTVASTFIFGNITPEALAGHDGEKAGYRLIRTCAENGVPILFVGDPENTPRCGVQPIDTFVDVLEDAAAVDGGILAEARSLVGIEYRTQANLYNQDAQVVLDYTDLTKTPAPKGDDRYIRNDVTVQRRGGSSRRATQTTGPLNTSSPLDDPQGVGVYDELVTLGLYSDGQLDDQVGWRLHLGTVDESRYPSLQVKLQRSTSLSTSVLGLDLGDRITISNLPSWLRPDTATQIARGYREYLESFRHEVEYSCTTESPYHIGVVGTSKVDSDGTYLAGPLSTTDTAVYTWVKTGPLWTTTGAQYPFALAVGGEKVTATACADAIEDAFTRTVSNGWGTADSGQSWTTSGGAASDYAVAGTGDITLTSVSVPRLALLGVDLANVDVTAAVETDQVATGGWITTALVARYTDASNYLTAQVEFKETGNVGIALYVVDGGSASFLAGAEIGTYLASLAINVRLQVDADAARAKLWYGNQPTSWTVEGIGADALASGDFGIRAELAAGNTNTNPVISWDDLTAPNLQRFTVTRSANSVVKSHVADTQIRLWDRTVIGMGV